MVFCLTTIVSCYGFMAKHFLPNSNVWHDETQQRIIISGFHGTQEELGIVTTSFFFIMIWMAPKYKHRVLFQDWHEMLSLSVLKRWRCCINNEYKQLLWHPYIAYSCLWRLVSLMHHHSSILQMFTALLFCVGWKGSLPWVKRMNLITSPWCSSPSPLPKTLQPRRDTQVGYCTTKDNVVKGCVLLCPMYCIYHNTFQRNHA